MRDDDAHHWGAWVSNLKHAARRHALRDNHLHISRLLWLVLLLLRWSQWSRGRDSDRVTRPNTRRARNVHNLPIRGVHCERGALCNSRRNNNGEELLLLLLLQVLLLLLMLPHVLLLLLLQVLLLLLKLNPDGLTWDNARRTRDAHRLPCQAGDLKRTPRWAPGRDDNVHHRIIRRLLLPLLLFLQLSLLLCGRVRGW